VLRKGGSFLLGGGLADWIEAGATYVIGSPAHYLHDRDRILAAQTPVINHAWIGGGPIHAHQLKELLIAFGTVHVTYGASEAGIVSAKAIPADIFREGPVTLGTVDPRCVLEIADESGNPLPPGLEGQLRMMTPWLVEGYLGDAETTQRVARRRGNDQRRLCSARRRRRVGGGRGRVVVAARGRREAREHHPDRAPTHPAKHVVLHR
jgi:acyl-CoA synthetase (AMP-forming)/AMP-acid ligase II